MADPHSLNAFLAVTYTHLNSVRVNESFLYEVLIDDVDLSLRPL